MTGWTTFLYALLPHPDQPLVLTQSHAGKASLPNMAYNGTVWIGDTGMLKPLLQELTGAPVNILRYVARHTDEETQESYQVHLLEPCDGAFKMNDSWQPLERILEESQIPLALHDGLHRWLEEQHAGIIPERRAPWAKLGWHARAECWIANQVLHLDCGEIHSIEPIKSWSISCVLKVTTEGRILYFKASRDLPLFVNEGAFLARLVELYPDRIPAPVAFAAESGWMLLDDFGEPLDRDAPLDQLANLMQDFARMQMDSSRKIESLLESGCKDRRIETLPSYIEPLFEDELVLSLLTSEERGKLREIVPQLRALIAELVALPIPAALVHGDLHAGNVIMRDTSFLYFDWTDAAVSHPYFDMIHIFLEEDEAKRTGLQEAYLSAWEESYPKADVRHAWQLAGTLYGLYHAVSYQCIAHGIEELVQPELNFAYFFLRKLLEKINRLDVDRNSYPDSI